MADNARGIHVSPGVYSREIDLTYAVKSLGITTLGMAGETLRGPAFQPMHIENWRQFTETFGGTSPEKYKSSQYPKYEMPYIAKSYLTESKQLEVVRVLGLSGYKAGPAWVVTAKRHDRKDMVVAVLRSRGYYEKYHKFDVTLDSCECPSSSYDRLIYEVGEVARESGDCKVVGFNNIVGLKPYDPLYAAGNDCADYEINGLKGSFGVSATNYGRFTVYGYKGFHTQASEGGSKTDWQQGLDYSKSGNTSAALSAATGYFEYPVSLNPFDKDYILKVLGTNPQDGDAPLYVESLYDVALGQAIMANSNDDARVETLNDKLEFYDVFDPSDYCGLKTISGMLRLKENALQRKHLGQRVVVDEKITEATGGDTFFAHPYDYETNLPILNGEVGASGKTAATTESFDDYVTRIGFTGTTEEKDELEKEWKAMPALVKLNNANYLGQIMTVVQYTDNTGKRNYFYRFYPQDNVEAWGKKKGNENVDLVPIVDKLINDYTDDKPYSGHVSSRLIIVKNEADGLYYRINDDGNAVDYVSCDLNNYASQYRYASTPWIISNLKGDYNHIEMTKLFRFHTISDGNNSNYEIKVSIENIMPDEGRFDVVVRAIDDADEYIVPLEKFSKCTLVPGDSNFIGLKIGTFDGMYEARSKYITVEVNEGTAVRNSVPAGFLGYPMAHYDGLQVAGDSHDDVVPPILKYNLYYDNDVKNRKQYFGLSSRVGVDVDTFTYKGKAAYIDEPEMLSNGFHLDARLDKSNYSANHEPLITVDGETGYEFDSVSVNSRTSTLTDIPAIGTEELMAGSIYQYVNLRKFTVYFYGGFDGWDPYRSERSNTDDFKLSKYKGVYDKTSGEGYSFNRIEAPEEIGLNQNGITSDWYAYLAGYRQFANPEAVDINVFATPGIDYVNNKTLVEEVIDMVEEERADSIYVVTTPDKPSGAADFVDEMYTPEDVIYNLEDSEIDSNYSCTYYPWVKYFDQDNNQYIYLPATKDAVRNFALTDNAFNPWYAPAGLSRGDVNCVRAHYITKLADEDTLYEGRVNPIKTFAADGVKIWGQKNLQIRESQLNRISVRRLLLRMRKLIAIACRSLIFEPNDPVTKNMFLTAVTPIMDNIRAGRGISDYRIEVNDTPESRDRHELPAKIYFKPIGALEYVDLSFILTPEGLSFDNI